MRIVWAIPCRGLIAVGDGTLVIQGAQIDSVVVSDLPVELQFSVAIRVVGRADEFGAPHRVSVTLTGPALDHIQTLDIPIVPREPTLHHIPGYELNCHLGAQILMTADELGGYDLSFAVDDEPQHHVRTTLSVVTPG